MELQDGMERIQVGAWQVELDSGRMTCGERCERLQPRVLQVLKFLVERHGKVVSKQQLLQKVWSDVAVSENALAQTISTLRAILSSDTTVRIETIPTLGYRLAGCVRALEESGPGEETGTAEPGGNFRGKRTIADLIGRVFVWDYARWIFLAVVLGHMLLFGHRSHPH